MRKVSEKSDLKKKEIVMAALELFFEYGYDGTSIRMIQKKINKQVAGFYYYFESKDDVFNSAIKLFFTMYEEKMKEIVDSGRSNPEHTLSKYIDYLQEATKKFRAQYLTILHWTILGAIREYTLNVIRKYIFEILEIYLEKGVVDKLQVNIHVAANVLAYSIGGSILYQTEEEFISQKEELYKLFPILNK